MFAVHRCSLVLAHSLVLFAAVSSDRSDILTKTVRESWISMENFATMLEVSLNLSACANVFISGRTPGTENLFNEFVKIYPYEYTLNNRTYYCDGYFMISTSVEKLVKAMNRVPTKISRTELLVVVDDKVDASSRLFNVSMYDNANVNIAAHNDLWSLSENFLKPRVFRRVQRHEQLIHNRGIVDLQGRELQVAAFYNPPLCYLRTTVNRTVNEVEGEFFVAKNQSEVDGIEVNLFMLIAKRLNFTWTIRKPNNYYRYGRPNGTRWNGGMIGQIHRQEVDVAFTGIWLKLDHYNFVNLSKPWTLFYIHFLVPRPRPNTSFWALTRPLSPEVWAAVFLMLTAQSIYVYTTAWMCPRVAKRFQSFTITWTELMGRLVGTWAPRTMHGLELQFQLWHLIGVLVVTAYSSSLAARLASSGYEKRIDTTRDFIEANLSWGREGPIPLFKSYFDYTDPYARQFPDRYEHENGNVDRHRKILNGNYAVVGRIVGGTFFPENEIASEDLKNFRVMKAPTAQFYTSFAVQPWLVESVDKVMLWLRETGLVVYHLRDVLHRRTGSALREVQVEHDGFAEGPRVLGLTPLGAGFSMLLAGLLVSAVVFYFELRSVAGKRPTREVLLQVKRNRAIWRAREARRKRELATLEEIKKKCCKTVVTGRDEWTPQIRKFEPQRAITRIELTKIPKVDGI